MQRLLIIFATVIFVVAGLVFISAAVLFKTDGGRTFIVNQVEPRLSKALGGQVSIGALEGTLPGNIIVRNIVLTDIEGDWLTIDKIEMAWSPFALLRRSVTIDKLTIDELTIIRAPENPEKEVTSAPPEGFEFPDSLPKVSVRSFALNNAKVRNPSSGDLITLNGDGALAMGGKKVAAAFNAASENNTDRFNASVDFDPAQTNAAVDIRLTSTIDGLLATIGKLGGPLSIKMTGDAPPETFLLTVDGALGAYGDVASTLLFDLTEKPAVKINGRAQLGDHLSALRSELGPEVAIDTTLKATSDGTQIVINSLAAEAVTASGEAVWRNRDGTLRAMEGRLKATLAPSHFTAIQKQLGATAIAAIKLSPKDKAYTLTSSLTTEHAQATLNDAKTDLATFFDGDLVLTLSENMAALTPLGTDLSLSAKAAFSKDGPARLNDVRISAGEDRIITGTGEYVIESGQVSADITLTAPQSFVTRLAPQLSPQDMITADINLSGPLDNFTAKVNADIPDVIINEATAPANRFVADLSGLPSFPNGDVSAKALEGNGAASFNLRSSKNGDIAVRDLRHVGQGFALLGDALINREQQSLSIDMKYLGEANASPFPGIIVEGDFHAKGALGANEATNNLTILSDSLSLGSVAVKNFTVEASGPANAIAVTIDAEKILTNNTDPISSLSGQALVQLDDTPFAAISGFSLTYDDTPVRLTQTATVSMGDMIELKTLRATIGQTGTLALDGAYSADRIMAQINATRLPAPQAAAFLDFSATIDTNNDLLTTGALALQPDSAEGDAGKLTMGFQWRDDRFYVTDENPDDAMSINLSAPMKLVRQPALSVEMVGDINGAVRYDGPAATLAAFLPTPLQSLEGALKTDITLQGDLENPQIDGELTLENGAYTELSSGLSLININMDARSVASLDGAGITFSGGASGPGQNTQTIMLDGAMSLGQTSDLKAQISMREALFSAAPVSSLKASGDITVSGPLDNLASVGEIIIDELNAEIITPKSTGLVDIEIVSTNGDATRLTANETAKKPSAFSTDIAIKADDKIFIRGRGLESEWSADVTANSGASGALILGRVDLRRGWLDFSGRRFNLTKGEITFNRLSPNDPFLDMRAEYETSDGTIAAIIVKGRSQSPAIELESTPSLPREDIMALVLFGKPANELSATESLQMAQALAQLGGIGPFGGGGLTGSARQALGLDLLNIDLDPETGGSALTVGKYVADGLFVSATQDVRGENGSIRIEYEITNNITVETELQQNGDQTVSANWKRDF